MRSFGGCFSNATVLQLFRMARAEVLGLGDSLHLHVMFSDYALIANVRRLP